MESTKQRDWLQVLGQFGVVTSLIFVHHFHNNLQLENFDFI